MQPDVNTRIKAPLLCSGVASHAHMSSYACSVFYGLIEHFITGVPMSVCHVSVLLLRRSLTGVQVELEEQDELPTQVTSCPSNGLYHSSAPC